MADFEVLMLANQTHTAQVILSAVSKQIGCYTTSRYKGTAQNIVLWGVGGVEQQKAYHAHRAKGGNVIMFDIGYFNRAGGSVRFSINDYHPQNLLRFARAGKRFDAEGIAMRNYADKAGHVMLCGMGKKSRAQFGYNGMQWENETVEKIRSVYDSRIVYRPKPKAREKIDGCDDGSEGAIYDYLRGCRLLVCAHSSAAIDACIAGVPVVCSDGAASYLYSNNLHNPHDPNEKARADFLRRVAWFNWLPTDAKPMMGFITEILRAL